MHEVRVVIVQLARDTKRQSTHDRENELTTCCDVRVCYVVACDKLKQKKSGECDIVTGKCKYMCTFSALVHVRM